MKTPLPYPLLGAVAIPLPNGKFALIGGEHRSPITHQYEAHLGVVYIDPNDLCQTDAAAVVIDQEMTSPGAVVVRKKKR